MWTSVADYCQHVLSCIGCSISSVLIWKNSSRNNYGCGSILILDDDPVQRIIAQRDLEAMKLKVIAPQRPIDLPKIDISNVSLVIVDRHLRAWHAAVENLIAALPSSVHVWEWTCDDWGQPVLNRIERTLQKRPGVLVNAVARWLENKVAA